MQTAHTLETHESQRDTLPFCELILSQFYDLSSIGLLCILHITEP